MGHIIDSWLDTLEGTILVTRSDPGTGIDGAIITFVIRRNTSTDEIVRPYGYSRDLVYHNQVYDPTPAN